MITGAAQTGELLMKALVLCALPLLVMSLPAAAYDDPAVAVCEFSWAKGEDLAQAGIRRVGAVIAGDTVTLSYEQSVLNTKPQTSDQICHFDADIRGELSLRFDRSARVDECSEITDRVKAAILQFGSKSAEARAFVTPLTDCQPILKAAYDLEMDRLKTISLPLLMMGIYPIKPENTELNVPVDRAKFQADCNAKQADQDKGVIGDELTIHLRACKDAGYLH